MSVPHDNMADISAAQRMAEKHQTYTEDQSLDSNSVASEIAASGNKMPGQAAGNGPEGNAPKQAIDPENQESFPSLGGGPKPVAHRQLAKWGPSNGVNGITTPPNGSATAGAPVAQSSGKPSVLLPGQHIESIVIEAEHILPRDQLKKPIPDIIKDVSRKFRVKITMSPISSGRYRIDATGPYEVVQQALKDLVQQIGIKITIEVAIPRSCRAHVIGRGGSTIRAIEEKTTARIRVPKSDKSTDGLEDDDSDIHVQVFGHTVSAASAQVEIMKIVDEHSQSVEYKLRGVAFAFYPFMAEEAALIEDAHDVKIHIPPLPARWNRDLPTEETGPHQTKEDDPPIKVTGGRDNVQCARELLDKLVLELRAKLLVRTEWIAQGTHQFIIGPRGLSMDDFFAETGCVVLLPADGKTDEVAVVGPEHRLSDGVQKATDLAGEMRSYVFDVARGIPDGVAHARNITRYLGQTGQVERLEATYNTIINTPAASSSSSSWEIYSRDIGSANQTQREIAKIVAAHPPSRMTSITVDPFFHSHLSRNVGLLVREKFGVRVVPPQTSETKVPVLLVYEAPFDAHEEYKVSTTKPTKADVEVFKKGLRGAQEHILSLIEKQEEIDSDSLEVPLKFHDKLRRFIKKEQQDLSGDDLPIRVTSRGTRVSLRGPASAVKAMTAKAKEFVEQTVAEEKERGYTISFDFPQKFANRLIGKGGGTIRDLREKFDVEIQVDDGKVELKGPKAKVEAAKAHILALGRTLADQTKHVLKIEPKYHGDLIGTQGATINRLQSRYKVHISFRRSKKPEDDDSSSNDGAPEEAQAADEVVITGPKKGADEAREELLGLYKYAKDHSFTGTVTVQQRQIPSIIGHGGTALEDLQMRSGARIDIPADRSTNLVVIKLRGTQAQVALAKQELEDKRDAFEDTIDRFIDVDPKFHKELIGPGGAHLREMVVKAGGSGDRKEVQRTIQVPRAETGSSTVRIEGRSAVVNAIVDDIESKVSRWQSQVTEEVDVPVEKRGKLIGRGGEVRRQMEDNFKVTIDFPRQGDDKTGVKITGRAEDIASAKKHMESLIRDQQGETVQVPKALHHAISDNGQFFRALRKDLKVTVDHAGHTVPPKPEPSRTNARSLPLITDDTAAKAGYSWSVVQVQSDVPGDIPWVLHGSADNVARAQKRLSEAMDKARSKDTMGLLTFEESSPYRKIIGPGGSTITSIRTTSGCNITVPRNQGPIEVVGSKEAVEKAKELMLAVVNDDVAGRVSA